MSWQDDPIIGGGGTAVAPPPPVKMPSWQNDPVVSAPQPGQNFIDPAQMPLAGPMPSPPPSPGLPILGGFGASAPLPRPLPASRTDWTDAENDSVRATGTFYDPGQHIYEQQMPANVQGPPARYYDSTTLGAGGYNAPPDAVPFKIAPRAPLDPRVQAHRAIQAGNARGDAFDQLRGAEQDAAAADQQAAAAQPAADAGRAWMAAHPGDVNGAMAYGHLQAAQQHDQLSRVAQQKRAALDQLQGRLANSGQYPGVGDPETDGFTPEAEQALPPGTSPDAQAARQAYYLARGRSAGIRYVRLRPGDPQYDLAHAKQDNQDYLLDPNSDDVLVNAAKLGITPRGGEVENTLRQAGNKATTGTAQAGQGLYATAKRAAGEFLDVQSRGDKEAAWARGDIPIADQLRLSADASDKDIKARAQEMRDFDAMHPVKTGAGRMAAGLIGDAPKLVAAGMSGPLGAGLIFGSDFAGRQYAESIDRGEDPKTATGKALLSFAGNALVVRLAPLVGRVEAESLAGRALAELGHGTGTMYALDVLNQGIAKAGHAGEKVDWAEPILSSLLQAGIFAAPGIVGHAGVREVPREEVQGRPAQPGQSVQDFAGGTPGRTGGTPGPKVLRSLSYGGDQAADVQLGKAFLSNGGAAPPGAANMSDADLAAVGAEVRRRGGGGGDQPESGRTVPEPKTQVNPSGDIGSMGDQGKPGAPARLDEETVYRTRLDAAKREIEADIKAGVIPPNVRTFSELHDYVDANLYVSDADRPDRLIGPLGKSRGWGTKEYADFTNRLVDGVDQWLQETRGNPPPDARTPAPTPGQEQAPADDQTGVLAQAAAGPAQPVPGRLPGAAEGAPGAAGGRDEAAAGAGAVQQLSPKQRAGASDIRAAAIFVPDATGGHKIIEGTTHGDAINKAIDSGDLTRDADGHLVDREGNDVARSGQIDLFVTKDGKLIDRFGASEKYDISSAEALNKAKGEQAKEAPRASLDEAQASAPSNPPAQAGGMAPAVAGDAARGEAGGVAGEPDWTKPSEAELAEAAKDAAREAADAGASQPDEPAVARVIRAAQRIGSSSSFDSLLGSHQFGAGKKYWSDPADVAALREAVDAGLVDAIPFAPRSQVHANPKLAAEYLEFGGKPIEDFRLTGRGREVLLNEAGWTREGPPVEKTQEPPAPVPDRTPVAPVEQREGKSPAGAGGSATEPRDQLPKPDDRQQDGAGDALAQGGTAGVAGHGETVTLEKGPGATTETPYEANAREKVERIAKGIGKGEKFVPPQIPGVATVKGKQGNRLIKTARLLEAAGMERVPGKENYWRKDPFAGEQFRLVNRESGSGDQTPTREAKVPDLKIAEATPKPSPEIGEADAIAPADITGDMTDAQMDAVRERRDAATSAALAKLKEHDLPATILDQPKVYGKMKPDVRGALIAYDAAKGEWQRVVDAVGAKAIKLPNIDAPAPTEGRRIVEEAKADAVTVEKGPGAFHVVKGADETPRSIFGPDGMGLRFDVKRRGWFIPPSKLADVRAEVARLNEMRSATHNEPPPEPQGYPAPDARGSRAGDDLDSMSTDDLRRTAREMGLMGKGTPGDLREKIRRERATKANTITRRPWQMTREEYGRAYQPGESDGLIRAAAGSDKPAKILAHYATKYPELKGVRAGRWEATPESGKLSDAGVAQIAREGGRFDAHNTWVYFSDDATPTTVRHEIEHLLDAIHGRTDAQIMDPATGRESFGRFRHEHFASDYSHRQSVKSALRGGEAVPPRVLAEYPDLTRRPGETATGDFASKVFDAARAVEADNGPGKGGVSGAGGKVTIGAAYDRYVKDHGPMPLDEFKAKVRESGLTMAGEDLIPQDRRAEFERSTVNVGGKGGADYHYLRTDAASRPKGKVYGYGGEPAAEGETRDLAKPEPVTPKEVGEGLLGKVGTALAGKDIAGVAKTGASAVMEAGRQLRGLLAPQTAGEQARQMQGIAREHGATLAQRGDRAVESLREARKAFDKMGVEASRDFIAKMEAGEKQSDPKLSVAADMIRKLLDGRREEVRALGKGKLEHFIQDYFPHIWEDPEAAAKVFAQILSKRPLEGSKGFLKKRSIDTFAAGIEAGLKPVSENPVDLVLLKTREMDRYILGQKMLEEMKGNGLAKFVRATDRAPEGYTKIDDKIAQVYGPPTVKVEEHVDRAQFEALDQTLQNLGIRHDRLASVGRSNLPGGQVLGRSFQGQDRIESKFGSDLSVIAHELGHQLDERYDLGRQLTGIIGGDTSSVSPATGGKFRVAGPKAEYDALTALRFMPGDKPSAKARAYNHKPEEQLAQVVEAFVHAPDRMQEVAPTLHKWFSDFVESHHELAPLRDARPSLAMKTLEGEVPHGGLLKMGEYYAPSAAAGVINNYLSPGLRSKSGLFRAYLGWANVMNQAQLGFSAFHLGFTSMEAMASKLSLGIKSAVEGRPIQAAAAIKGIPLAPITNILRGSKLLREWLKPGSEGADIAQMVDGLRAAGGRAKQDDFYRTNMVQKMTDAFKQGNIVGGLWRAPFALADAVTKPIMEYAVPRQKLGIFADMARRELEKLGPNASRDEVRHVLGKAWDSVDNRVGAVVYDNLFFNRMVKDLGMASVRSLGWNLGTFRELGGGVLDFGSAAARIAMRKRPEFTHRMAYTLAMPVLAGAIGGMTHYIMTGQHPDELKDWFFPKTGEKDANGHDIRMSLPSYMKDVYAYSDSPGQTASHKLHPALSTVSEMLQNKDFYGTKIRNEDDPAMKQAMDMLKHVGKQFIPLGVQGYNKLDEEGASMSRKVLPFVGVTQAPQSLSLSPAEKMAKDLREKAFGGMTRTQDQAERSQVKAEMAKDIKTGKPGAAGAPSQATSEGKLTKHDVKDVRQRAGKDFLQRMVKPLAANDAMKVWEAATPEERSELRMILREKIQKSQSIPQADQQRLMAKLN
jgi:hypothetical protein